MNTMKEFRVEYFSTLDWKKIQYNVLAENKEQVIKMVNEEIEPQFRSRSTYSRNAEYKEEDSLVIYQLNDITIPFKFKHITHYS